MSGNIRIRRLSQPGSKEEHSDHWLTNILLEVKKFGASRVNRLEKVPSLCILIVSECSDEGLCHLFGACSERNSEILALHLCRFGAISGLSEPH
jgi:hypothetical protein